MEQLVHMKLLLVGFLLLTVIDCVDRSVQTDARSPVDSHALGTTPGSKNQIREERPPRYRGRPGRRRRPSTEEGGYSHEDDWRRFLYGVTYFPWRRTMNCSDISEMDIRKDFQFMSQVARSVQIFELFCNFTPTIVQLTAAEGMNLLIGISIETETEYQRQKTVLKTLLQTLNLSHVLAITVGHTSAINGGTKDSIKEKFYEVADIVLKSGYPNIPVTIIDDSHERHPWPLGPTEVVRVDMNPVTPVDFFKTFDRWLDEPKIRDPEKAKRTYYTGFSYPFASQELNQTNPEPFPLAESGYFPPPAAIGLEKLACLGVTGPKPGWRRPFPEPFGKHGPLSKIPEIKVFYHSAFDMVFEYGENDPRSHYGLADAATREMKGFIFNDIIHRDHEFPDFGFCMDMKRGYEKHEEGNRRESLYQWIAIGVSLSLALMAFTALAGIICYRKRMVDKLRRKKESQQQQLDANLGSTSAAELFFDCEASEDTYIRTLASYLNRRADSYVDVISKSDYENLSALVGPEWLIEESALRFEEIIGEGHFGIVQRATLTRYGEAVDVAVKRLHVGAKNVRQFLSEGILMEQFHHPNILPLVGISFTSYYLPMIITPFMERGDLLSFVKNGENRLTVRQLLKFGLEIADGMSYMHNLKLIHRDLAARNCMLDDSVRVCIADFGLCRDVSDSDSYQTARASDIPIRWMPPETIEKLEWTNKSDVWSYGIVLWELFTRGKQPYTRVPLIELRAFLRSGGRLSKPDGCPDVIYDLMKNCWHGQAEQRPAFAQLCESIPALVQALEGEQILDLPDYYNALTVMEMSQQPVPKAHAENKPSGPVSHSE